MGNPAEHKMTYEVTAKFDDGLYKIVDGQWVAIERWAPRSKTIDYRADPFGLAESKIEGEPVPYPLGVSPSARKPRRFAWVSRVTEWPRRKLARGLSRLANWICYNRDEGW